MENEQDISIQEKKARSFGIIWGSAIPSFFIALIWALDFVSSSSEDDSLGLAIFFEPILYVIALVTLFFFVWPPIFGVSLGICKILRHTSSCSKKVWIIWFLSLLPFCFSLWFFLKAPSMAKYRIFHL